MPSKTDRGDDRGDWGVIIVRLWAEASSASGFRARVSTSVAGRDAAALAVADSVDDLCRAIREWLIDEVESLVGRG